MADRGLFFRVFYRLFNGRFLTLSFPAVAGIQVVPLDPCFRGDDTLWVNIQ